MTIARVATTAATVSYAANCLLGIAVATRRIDTRRHRWIHHALYALTVSLTATGIAAAARTEDRRTAPLTGALVVLSLIPFVGTHNRRHVVTATSAAPFFLAANVIAGRWSWSSSTS